MPLSEREKRILEEIEKGLAKEDPSFVRNVRERAPRMAERRQAQLGLGLVGLGIACLLGFFITGLILIGVAAFGAMVAGIVIIAGAWRGAVAPRRPPRPSPRARLAERMKDLEQRLRDRYDRR